LKQVIINLTSNAVKFKKEGFVRIKVGRFDGTDPDMMVIMVEDSGAGIPEEKRVLLFERYEQLSRQVQGSGLGLCLTLHLVEAMNGTIELDDTYYSGLVDHPGTRFVVKIPMPHINKLDAMSTTTDEDSNQVSKEEPSDSEISVTHNMKVLVVDDDALIRRLVTRRLQNIDKSMVIEQAENGEQAIAMIVGPDGSDFDLVLVDHYMPLCGGELTGEETIAKIRPYVAGLIIGSSGNNMKKEHTAAGADLFWQKPIPKNDILIRDLQRALRGKIGSI
jgi:CheY-like chemotaxis protein